MNKASFLFVLLFSLVDLQAQSPQATIKKIVLRKEQIDLQFPLVIMADSVAAKKINTWLQHELLEQPAPGTGKKIFDRVVWTAHKSGLDELAYTILINSDRLISLEFDGEDMGAYPSSFEQYFQFNARTGALIRLEDIITPAGRKALETDLRKKRETLISNHLEELKKDTNARADLDLIREDLHSANEDAEPELFSIRPHGLRFHKGNSLPHVIQELDADLDIDYNFHQISPWLNDFGKKLLLNP
jgi:hypothetical protein